MLQSQNDCPELEFSAGFRSCSFCGRFCVPHLKSDWCFEDPTSSFESSLRFSAKADLYSLLQLAVKSTNKFCSQFHRVGDSLSFQHDPLQSQSFSLSSKKLKCDICITCDLMKIMEGSTVFFSVTNLKYTHQNYFLQILMHYYSLHFEENDHFQTSISNNYSDVKFEVLSGFFFFCPKLFFALIEFNPVQMRKCESNKPTLRLREKFITIGILLRMWLLLF